MRLLWRRTTRQDGPWPTTASPRTEQLRLAAAWPGCGSALIRIAVLAIVFDMDRRIDGPAPRR